MDPASNYGRNRLIATRPRAPPTHRKPCALDRTHKPRHATNTRCSLGRRHPPALRFAFGKLTSLRLFCLLPFRLGVCLVGCRISDRNSTGVCRVMRGCHSEVRVYANTADATPGTLVSQAAAWESPTLDLTRRSGPELTHTTDTFDSLVLVLLERETRILLFILIFTVGVCTPNEGTAIGPHT